VEAKNVILQYLISFRTSSSPRLQRNTRRACSRQLCAGIDDRAGEAVAIPTAIALQPHQLLDGRGPQKGIDARNPTMLGALRRRNPHPDLAGSDKAGHVEFG
jgi:hypothetical protein